MSFFHPLTSFLQCSIFENQNGFNKIYLRNQVRFEASVYSLRVKEESRKRTRFVVFMSYCQKSAHWGVLVFYLCVFQKPGTLYRSWAALANPNPMDSVLFGITPNSLYVLLLEQPNYSVSLALLSRISDDLGGFEKA